MTAVCQRCQGRFFDWTIRQAEFHVGTITHWKIQLCENCTRDVDNALVPLLAMRRPKDNPPIGLSENIIITSPSAAPQQEEP